MLFEAIGFMITQGWRVLTSVQFPGIQLSIATILIGVFIATMGIRIVYKIAGIGMVHEVGNWFRGREKR